MSYPPESQQPEQPVGAPYTPETPTQAQPSQSLPTEPYPAEQFAPTEQSPAYQQAPQAYSYDASQSPYQAPVTALPTTLTHTNTFALVSILTVFLMPLAGIIFGHIGLSQIKRNGDAGRGLALTGLILGYAYFVFILMFIIFYISIIGIVFASMGAAMGDIGSYEGLGESW